MRLMSLTDIFAALKSIYGNQNWWPMQNDFQPKELEIVIGTILTQNTNWNNVEKALKQLKSNSINTLETILETDTETISGLIRPSGYYRQKAERLKQLSETIRNKGGVKEFLETITREQLMNIKGIGPETADSILLYAANRPFFVVDAYTKRVFSRLKIINSNWDYETIRRYFETNLGKNTEMYKEFHALIVYHAKKFCRKRPLCTNCILKTTCRYRLDFISQETPNPAKGKELLS